MRGGILRAFRLAWVTCALLALHAAPTFALTPTPGVQNQNLFSSPTVTQTLTPSATVTPSLTPTQTYTTTPSSTATITSTPTRTSTRTATGTVTQTPTITSTITLTPTRTRTPTITLTPTRTATRTVTQTGTITETPTITQTPTVTPTRVVEVNIGSGTGLHGATIPITVSLVADGRQVAAAGNDIAFNNTHLSWSLANCSANPSLGKALSGGVVSVSGTTTTVRLFVLGAPLSTDPIPDGPLYTCNFTILGSAPTGSTTLTNSNPIAQDPDGVNLTPVTGANGAITVTLVGGQTPTPTPQRVVISIGSGSVGTNSSIAISANITTSSQQVAGAGNDLAYNTAALTLVSCSANPALGKVLETGTVGAYGTVTVVRIGVVGAPLSLDPIPDGLLYTCLFTTNTTTGTYNLTGANYIATDPDGNPVTPVSGLNGAVSIVSGFPTATRTITPIPTATSIPTPLTRVFFRTDQTDLQQVGSRGAWSTSCYPTPGARLRMGPTKEGTPTALDCAGGYTVCARHNSCTNGASAATECLERQSCVQAACRCGGDCNGDGTVTSTEINTAVAILGGTQPLSACPSADISGDGIVTGSEITKITLNSSNGCPMAPACRPGQTCRAGKCHPLILCDSVTSAATQCLARQSCISVALAGGSTQACVCAGDCNNDGRVTGADLTTITQIINGQAPLSACPAADPNGDGTVRASEYTVALNNQNLGCP